MTPRSTGKHTLAIRNEINPAVHIKPLLGVLIIALVLLAMACGASTTEDLSTPEISSDSTASVNVVEEDTHDAETVALDAHDDDHDALNAEPIALDAHDDDHGTNGEPIALDAHDDDHDTNGDNVLEITLNVVEGKAPWGFDPEVIEVPLGHRVKLTLINGGRVEHDVEISNLMAEHIETTAGTAPHDRLGGGGHDDATVAAHAMPGTTASVTFTPTMAGEYEFHCTLPGHRELGMVGKIIVTNDEA